MLPPFVPRAPEPPAAEPLPVDDLLLSVPEHEPADAAEASDEIAAPDAGAEELEIEQPGDSWLSHVERAEELFVSDEPAAPAAAEELPWLMVEDDTKMPAEEEGSGAPYLRLVGDEGGDAGNSGVLGSPPSGESDAPAESVPNWMSWDESEEPEAPTDLGLIEPEPRLAPWEERPVDGLVPEEDVAFMEPAWKEEARSGFGSADADDGDDRVIPLDPAGSGEAADAGDRGSLEDASDAGAWTGDAWTGDAWTDAETAARQAAADDGFHPSVDPAGDEASDAAASPSAGSAFVDDSGSAGGAESEDSPGDGDAALEDSPWGDASAVGGPAATDASADGGDGSGGAEADGAGWDLPGSFGDDAAEVELSGEDGVAADGSELSATPGDTVGVPESAGDPLDDLPMGASSFDDDLDFPSSAGEDDRSVAADAVEEGALRTDGEPFADAGADAADDAVPGGFAEGAYDGSDGAAQPDQGAGTTPGEGAAAHSFAASGSYADADADADPVDADHLWVPETAAMEPVVDRVDGEDHASAVAEAEDMASGGADADSDPSDDAAGAPASPLHDVAARLEEIAASLRTRTPAELLSGASDPLEIMIAGYVLGYTRGASGAGSRGGE